jgi:anaerobic magnesium-protoporphyrin IX monomethyl ester cyclase
MKVLLAGPDYEENLSIRYLSGSLLSAGHKTVLAAFNAAAEIGAVANAAQDADVVGLSICFQARAKEFLALAREIKSRDPKKLVVAGGHYASCAAGALLANHPEIDIVVIHEGERTLVEIADALPRLEERLPEIAGIAYRSGVRGEGRVCFTKARPTVEDLDSLPAPDRRGPVHMVAGVPTSYLMGSRGCYGNCAYCCITTLHRLAPGKRFRQREVERVADEMAALYWERGTRQFVFHDDNFLVPSEARNHERISGLEKALKRGGVENIALLIKCRPADANERVLRRLKELGLVRVFLGVEAATARGLTALERNQSVDDSVRRWTRAVSWTFRRSSR